jgi:hypothetical protein
MKTGFKNINMRQRVPALRAGMPAFRAKAYGAKATATPPVKMEARGKK